MNILIIENLRDSARHGPQPLNFETPKRLETVVDALQNLEFNDLDFMSAPKITDELARLFHSEQYLDSIKAAVKEASAKKGPVPIGDETLLYADSLDAVYTAAGAGIAGVEKILRGDASSVFVAVRSPGHHAEAEKARGYCLLSNAGLAALYARNTHNLRVAVIDIDIHNGNGTEKALRQKEGTMFAEIYMANHPINSFPYASEQLPDLAENVTRIGLEDGTTGVTWSGVFTKEILPRVSVFKPDLVICSAGFDCMQGDPVGGFGVSADDILSITKKLKAEVNVPVISFLEGGYSLENLRSGVSAHVTGLRG